MSSKKSEPVITSFIKIAEEKSILSRESILDKIAKQPATKKDLKPSDSFDQNLLTLCNALRERGFKTYAEELERKFTLYKSAETHLYRTHDEDGEDLIEFAHPEGDNKIAPAKNELGDVETIVSRHQKIVEVVNKRPTGKLSEAVEYILGFKKKAQELDKTREQLSLALQNSQSAVDLIKKTAKPGSMIGSQLENFLSNIKSKSSGPIDEDTFSSIKVSIKGIMRIAGTLNKKFFDRYLYGVKDFITSMYGDVASGDWDLSTFPTFRGLEEAFGLIGGGQEVDEKVVKEMLDHLTKAIFNTDEAKKIYVKTLGQEALKEDKPAVSEEKDMSAKFNDFKTKIQSSTKFNDDQKKLILNWLDTKVKPLAESTNVEDKQRADKMLTAAEDKYKP